MTQCARSDYQDEKYVPGQIIKMKNMCQVSAMFNVQCARSVQGQARSNQAPVGTPLQGETFFCEKSVLLFWKLSSADVIKFEWPFPFHNISSNVNKRTLNEKHEFSPKGSLQLKDQGRRAIGYFHKVIKWPFWDLVGYPYFGLDRVSWSYTT